MVKVHFSYFYNGIIPKDLDINAHLIRLIPYAIETPSDSIVLGKQINDINEEIHKLKDMKQHQNENKLLLSVGIFSFYLKDNLKT
jgi:hypothetical protein